MKFFRAKILIGVAILVALIALGTYFYFSKTRNCIFVNRNICLVGEKYQKYTWTGDLAAQAFKFKKEQKIKAPFDGTFTYTPIAYVNFEGETRGSTSVIVFTDKAGNKIRLYAQKISLLLGSSGNMTTVKKGKSVAKIKPVPISFLDDYNAVKVFLPKN